MMLMLMLCVIMKIAEELTPRIERCGLYYQHVERPSAIPMPCGGGGGGGEALARHHHVRPRRRRRYHRKRSGKTTTTTTTTTTMMDEPQTPGSDCNSNPANENQDHVSSAFIQDNTDFWFIDYRDGGLHVHPSVLSSLSASYTKDDLGYYDDLARNLDANLAEVDMENCKTSDLHTLLNALPTMCTDPVQHSEFNYQREEFATLTGSVMEEIGFKLHDANSQGEDSACSTTSICKSSLLFSPVKEIPVLPTGASYSVDSLDCEDMLITCKTNNKDNYTIAFEGSMAMYSDSSDNQDFDNHGEGQKRMIGGPYEAPDSYYGQALNLKNMLDLSMACSDTKIYTTWSNLYKHINAKTMKRHPSGNNNTEPNFLLQQSTGAAGAGVGAGGCDATDAASRAVIAAANDAFNSKSRSRSLPDLKRSAASKNALNFSVDSGETSSRNSSNNRLQSSASMMSRSITANDHEDNDDKSSDNSVCGANTLSSGSNSNSNSSSSATGTGSKKLHNMSLVRLYMKQKSTSAEGMSLTLDSESEGCWPTTSNSGECANNGATSVQPKQQQQQQNNNGGSNDLAIKWVKNDSLATTTATTTTTEATSQAYKKMSTIACSTSMDDLTSRSILSLAKDDAGNSCSDKSKLLSDDASNCTTLKISTGIQAKAVETEDNGVQTSLIYPPLGEQQQQTSPDSGKASSSNSNNTISTSSLKQQTTTREHIVNTEKPVYVVYPNYALPDLSFLSAVSADRISLKPQAFRPGSRVGRRPFSCGDFDALKHRNFNHVKDWDSLNFLLPKEYRQALGQCTGPETVVAAASSKQPLYWLQPRSKKRAMFFNDAVAAAAAAHHHQQQNATNLSSSSSTGTQPSSGYRGSSTILSDSSANQNQNSANSATGNNPLYLYRYDSVSSEASLLGQEKQQINRQQQMQTRGAPTLPKRSVSLPQNECPPRPPLPRGILRKHHRAAAAAANNNNAAANVAGKRSSMFEQGGNYAMEPNCESNKRMSLQEPYFMNNDLHFLKNAGVLESEKDIDEAEEKQQFDRLRGFDNEEPLSLDDEFKQLDDFLSRSNYSTCSDDSSCDLDKSMKLRSCVKKFLALKINQDIPKMIDMTDSQKKTVSFAVNRKQGLLMQDMIAKDRLNVSEATDQKMDNRPINLEEKKKLIKSVGKAVDVLLKYWNSEPVRSRQDYNDKNECSQLCLNYLCPAIYAVMSDELKPHLDSTFGPIANSVWQVVEASSQQGPLTKTLNDLVQKINAEDFIPEGMLKFRAFVFGLLNLRSLDAWFAYLCSRESVVRKHYKSSNLFVSALSCPASREVVDSLLNVLQPLIYCPFQLDLLYQYRQLHNSFGVPSSEQVIKRSVRPRSCVMYDEDNKKDEGEAKKRWSHNPMSAMFHVQDRLDDSDDYTDSLEHTPMKKASLNNKMTSKVALRKEEAAAAMKSAEAKGETHFRKLQEKWECLGRDDSSPKEAYPLQSPSSLASPTTPTRTLSFNKSKIPRPLMSPVKSPSGLPVPVKNPRASAIPAPKKSAASSTTAGQKKSPTQPQESPRRTSRVDQTGASSQRSPMTRPSSLPYKTYQGQQDRNGVVHRRAASTSLPRPHSIAAPPSRHISSKQPAPKLVRATSSRPPSQSGHLAFTEGETIKVILEVDAKWLLCERGTRKGLVPRNCVKPLPT
uniref:Iporin n=1 Tax=Trichogramma kaykai TaxID=54128 RepID=A0ABD2XDI0_9HYME